MSLYSDYLKERENAEVIESENGFLSYQIFGTECFLKDVFVSKEHRHLGEVRGLVGRLEVLAKAAGCKLISATICPATNGATDSLHAALHTGFKLYSADLNRVVIVKEI
jgi:hypothetical protein